MRRGTKGTRSTLQNIKQTEAQQQRRKKTRGFTWQEGSGDRHCMRSCFYNVVNYIAQKNLTKHAANSCAGTELNGKNNEQMMDHKVYNKPTQMIISRVSNRAEQQKEARYAVVRKGTGWVEDSAQLKRTKHEVGNQSHEKHPTNRRGTAAHQLNSAEQDQEGPAVWCSTGMISVAASVSA